MLLLLLMEEASEVAQNCSKLLRFGVDHVSDEYGQSNAERLFHEIVDYDTIVSLLRQEGVFDKVDQSLYTKLRLEKLKRIDYYMSRSKALGTLDDKPTGYTSREPDITCSIMYPEGCPEARDKRNDEVTQPFSVRLHKDTLGFKG
jgi:hypothetical protein